MEKIKDPGEKAEKAQHLRRIGQLLGEAFRPGQTPEKKDESLLKAGKLIDVHEGIEGR